jgi:hypothetical protein
VRLPRVRGRRRRYFFTAQLTEVTPLALAVTVYVVFPFVRLCENEPEDSELATAMLSDVGVSRLFDWSFASEIAVVAPAGVGFPDASVMPTFDVQVPPLPTEIDPLEQSPEELVNANFAAGPATMLNDELVAPDRPDAAAANV